MKQEDPRDAIWSSTCKMLSSETLMDLEISEHRWAMALQNDSPSIKEMLETPQTYFVTYETPVTPLMVGIEFTFRVEDGNIYADGVAHPVQTGKFNKQMLTDFSRRMATATMLVEMSTVAGQEMVKDVVQNEVNWEDWLEAHAAA